MPQNTETILATATNFYGPLDAQLKARIRAFLAKPSIKTWVDVHTIIIRKRGHLTLWEAVLEIDPEIQPWFPPAPNGQGWRKVPSPFVVLRAIQNATRAA